MHPGVTFYFKGVSFALKDRKKLKEFIKRIFKKEKTPLQQLDYVFCTDEFLLDLNRDYLNHDTFTDIITFDLSEKGEPLTAEIYISAERVRENSESFSVSFTNELLRVMFHGALHLCGYKDKGQADRLIMRQKENDYLKIYKSFHVKQ